MGGALGWFAALAWGFLLPSREPTPGGKVNLRVYTRSEAS